MARKTVTIEKLDDILFLNLNRPEKRNALSPELIHELQKSVDQVKQMPEIRAVIITGEGTAFCAGADLAYLEEMSRYDEDQNLEDSRILMKLFQDIYTLPKLTIAMVNGPALAGGCGLALCCDIICADEDSALFGFTEVKIGFIPAIVMNFLIRKTDPGKAYRTVLEGDILSTADAEKIGMVHQVFKREELRDGTMKLVNRLLDRNSFGAMMQTKKLFQELLDKPLEEGLQLAARVNAQSRKSPDCRKGLHHFLNKKKLNWRKL